MSVQGSTAIASTFMSAKGGSLNCAQSSFEVGKSGHS